MNYHAHVYWRNAVEEQTASEIRTYLIEMGMVTSLMHQKPIGPHPYPMFEVDYDDSNKVWLETFLSSFDLSVLLHEYTGSHVRDHTEGARWFNDELDLDIDFLVQLDAINERLNGN